MHQCVHLSITPSQPVINWFALRKSGLTFGADYCQRICHLCCMSPWSMECAVFPCGLCATSAEPPWWFILFIFFVVAGCKRVRSTFGPNQWLQSLAVYSFMPPRLIAHAREHTSWMRAQTNRSSMIGYLIRRGEPKMTGHPCQPQVFMCVCVCLCEAGLDTTGLILRIKGPRRLMWRPALSRGCFLIPSSSGADWIRRNTCLWYKCKGAIWILRTSSKPEVSHQTPCCWSTNLRACAAGVCTGERGSDCSCFWKTF